MIEPLYDIEKEAVRQLVKNGVNSYGSITAFLMQCRVARNLHHMSEEVYADTLKKSTKAYIAMYREVQGIGSSWFT